MSTEKLHAAPISHDRAAKAVERFVNNFWKRAPGPRIGIPARPYEDDDIVLNRYIEQQRALCAHAADQAEPVGWQEMHSAPRNRDILIELRFGSDGTNIGWWDGEASPRWPWAFLEYEPQNNKGWYINHADESCIKWRHLSPPAAAAQPDPKTQDDDAWLLIHRQREALLHGKQEPFDPARMPQEVQQAYDAAQAMLEATEPLDVPEFLRASSYQAKLDMSPQSQPASEPVAWWNGFRQNDDPDSPYGPSISWRGENSAHDIPLFSGWNPESELMRELVSLRAAAPRINEGSKHQSIESAADKPSENAAPPAAVGDVTDAMVRAALRAPVACGESVQWMIIFGMNSDDMATRHALSHEIVRTVIEAALRERVS